MSVDAAYLDAAIANVCRQLAEYTASPKPSYSAGGRSVEHDGHYKALLDSLKDLRAQRQIADGPFEVRSFGA